MKTFVARTLAGLGILAGTAGIASAQVVINEFLYDPASTDVGEFVELYNAGGSAVDISNWTVVLVNGSAGTSYTPTATIPAATSLAAGDYFVIGNATTIHATYPGVVDLDVAGYNNGIQNGGPDAIVLKDSGGNRMDSVNYEADATFVVGAETANATAEGGVGRSVARLLTATTTNITLGRYPDGTDTGSNFRDFRNMNCTPGSANTLHSLSFPFTDSFGTIDATAWREGFVAARSVDPTAVGKPGIASSNGGNVIEVFDSTGGGDTANILLDLSDIEFKGEIWIPATVGSNGWVTGVGILTRNDGTFFSNFTANSVENGVYLLYQNGPLDGTDLSNGAIASSAGVARLIAYDGSTSIGTGNVSNSTATSLGTPATPVAGAWNTFSLSYSSSLNKVRGAINGTEIYNGPLPAGINTSGGVTIGFREQHAGTPVAGEGTWVDGIEINTSGLPVELDSYSVD